MFEKDFVLLDLEFTANEDSRVRKWADEHREIIQIAAIGVTPELEQRWLIDLYVRPKVQPKLSEFIKEFTSISQAEVDSALPLARALVPVAELCRQSPVYCYGTDGEVIRESCELYRILFPFFPDQFVNLKPKLSPTLRDVSINPDLFLGRNVDDAFGMPWLRPHNARHDIVNLLGMLRVLRTRGKL